MIKHYITDIFEDYFYFGHKNIILDSIRVILLDDNGQFKSFIPFDIQVAGENAFRIVPSISDGKFSAMYEYIGDNDNVY